MRYNFGISFAILIAVLAILPVRTATACVVCRAMKQLHECNDTDVAHPPTGAVGVVGTVVKFDIGDCGEKMTVEVIKSSRASLPQRITFDLSSCWRWDGKTGDTLRIMVDEIPSADGRYSLRACK
jgi:hypothetical protein